MYNADVAGGWGVVALQGTNQFLFSCKLVIGDGSTSTYFSDSDTQIALANGVLGSANENFFDMKSKSYCNFGVLVDATEKTTRSGCVFIHLGVTYSASINGLYSNNEVNFYGCSFTSTTQPMRIRGTTKIYNCILSNLARITAACVDVFNLQVFSSTSGAGGMDSVAGTFDKITVFDSMEVARHYGNYAGTENAVISNVYARNNTYLYRTQSTRSWDTYFVNCDSDTWTFQHSGTFSGKVYRQYEFDLSVTNSTDMLENANVTLIKGETVLSYLTNSTGQIPTQTLTLGYYNQTYGDVIQDAGQWNLTITYPTYTTYTTLFWPLEKTNWAITLTPEPPPTAYTFAAFTFTPTNPDLNTTVAFDASPSNSSGTIISYDWDFGDDSTDTGVTAEHAYLEAGNYTVTLTVTSDVGEAEAVQIVNVGEYETTFIIIGIICAIVAAVVAGVLIMAKRRND